MSWETPSYDRWGETPAGYKPEEWDVVRDDGLRLIEGTTILDADTHAGQGHDALRGSSVGGFDGEVLHTLETTSCRVLLDSLPADLATRLRAEDGGLVRVGVQAIARA